MKNLINRALAILGRQGGLPPDHDDQKVGQELDYYYQLHIPLRSGGTSRGVDCDRVIHLPDLASCLAKAVRIINTTNPDALLDSSVMPMFVERCFYDDDLEVTGVEADGYIARILRYTVTLLTYGPDVPTTVDNSDIYEIVESTRARLISDGVYHHIQREFAEALETLYQWANNPPGSVEPIVFFYDHSCSASCWWRAIEKVAHLGLYPRATPQG